MEWIGFLKQYIKNPRTVGAIAPSSQKLAEKMVEGINFNNCRCIVEYGPGTGVFTDLIVKNKKADTLFLAVEYNPDFYKNLKERYKGRQGVVLINGSAEHVKKFLAQHKVDKADYIISGLPFASLPADMSQNILTATKEVLKAGGRFITFQYTLFKLGLFNGYFNDIGYDRVLLNIPPAYVLRCGNK